MSTVMPITLAASDVAQRLTTGKPFPAAGVRVTDTVRLQNVDAPTGPVPYHRGQRTKLVWSGPSNVPVISLENCRDGVFDAFDVVCETPCEAAFVVERTKTGPGVIPSTMHQFRNVRIFGNGHASRGIWYRGIDENNEHMRADCVSVYGCNFAFRFEGQQSKEHLLTHCRIESAAFSGVESDSGFHMIGGTIAVSGVAVELRRVGDPVTLIGVGVEACERILVTAGPSTASQPVALVNCRYEADQLHDDGDMIVMRHAGALTITGGRYGGGQQPIPYIRAAGVGVQVVTNGGGITFGSFGADQVSPVRANPGVTLLGGGTGMNLYQRSEAAIASDDRNGQNVQAMPGWQV